MKNQKGITLVALVVTIVVLLILAGTTIVLVMQGDSIFGKAETAGKETNEGAVKDVVSMALLAVQTEKADPTEESEFHDVAEADILSKANEVFTAELKRNLTIPTTDGLALTSFNDKTNGTVANGDVGYKGKTYTVTINTKAATVEDQLKVVPK